VEIAKLAVETGAYPLYEIVEGKHVINRPKDVENLKPVEEYLKMQGRFRHLFKPEKNEEAIDFIQKRVKENLKWLIECSEKGL
jgi:pyruvate ferredoxin oxidoreductase beta subunit